MEKYTVRINGTAVPVYTAAVSALPLNRVWDGNQRPADQAEEGYYVSFDLEGRAVMEIEAAGGFEAYEIRPKCLRLPETRTGNRVTLTVTKPMQFTFEPDGYHHALHVFVNPKSEKPSGDILYFGKGEHRADLIWLTSNQTLYIDEGAVVHGVVYAKDAENIRIMGRGVLDASSYRRGNDEHDGGRQIIDALRQKGFAELDVKYYGNLVLNHCRNVLVEGIILKDAPMWSLITRNNCEQIVIDNIKIIGQWRYNADGIDICTSKNVTVRNSFVRSFDDCLVARGAYLEGEEGCVENVTVENCVFWCDWGKSIELWCGQKPTAIRNITVKDCCFIHLSSAALNIATWYGSGNSVVENILFRNIRVDADTQYRNLVVEKPGREGYSAEPGFVPYLLHISAEKLGIMRGLGTQICEPVQDYSAFRIRYRNILLDNIRSEDKSLRVDVWELEGGVLEIQNLLTVNCDFQITKRIAPPGNRMHAGTEVKSK